MKTVQGKMAKDAITALEHRAEAAESQVLATEQLLKRQDHEIAVLNRQNENLAQQLRETERRMYAPTAGAITDYMRITNDYDMEFDRQVIRIEPRSVQMALTRRELFDAKLPLEVIDRHIGCILQMHTDDLRKQLRAAVWPRR